MLLLLYVPDSSPDMANGSLEQDVVGDGTTGGCTSGGAPTLDLNIRDVDVHIGTVVRCCV